MKHRLLILKIVIVLAIWCKPTDVGAQLHEIQTTRSKIIHAVDSLEKGQYLAHLAHLYTSRNLDSSGYFAMQALTLARDLNVKELEARAAKVLAYYHVERGNPYLGYKYANESLFIFEGLRLQEQVAEATMNLGVFLLREGKVDQGRQQIQRAFELSERLPKDSIRAMILINRAQIMSMEVPLREIDPLLDEAKEIAEKYHNEPAIFAHKFTRLTAGLHRPEYQNPEGFSEQMNTLLTQADGLGFVYFQALGNLELGRVFSRRDQADSAIFYYDRALQFAQQSGFEALEFSILGLSTEVLAKLPENSGKQEDYKARMLYMSSQRADLNRDEGMDFLQMAYNEKDLEINLAKNRIIKHWNGILTVLITLILVAILLLFRIYRAKRKLARALRRSNLELSKRNLKLVENEEFYERLVGMLSHDLRQPFAIITMMSDRMLKEMDRVQLNRIFSEINQSATVSLQIMDGLLFWMKLQLLGTDHLKTVAVAPTIFRAMEFCDHLINQRKIDIMVSIPDSARVVGQDEILLFINRNIIHNAIIHSFDEGGIWISVETDHQQGHLIVKIRDEGKGIPADVLPNLFTKGGGVDDQNRKNAGLSLIVCAEMLKKMGGRIWAENNVDQGACFCYSLPLPKQDTAKEDHLVLDHVFENTH